MNTFSILTFIIILILLILIVTLYLKLQKARKINETQGDSKEVMSGINKERSKIKEERKAKILEVAQSEGEINNDGVQNLFDVSDATATNYLSELEKEGKLEQIGEAGRGIYYKIKA